MEFFRKGSDPPLPIFGSYGTHEAYLIFGHQKGEKLNFPKTLKMAIFKINFLEKCLKVSITLYFTQNIARIAEAAMRKSYRLLRCRVVFSKICH